MRRIDLPAILYVVLSVLIFAGIVAFNFGYAQGQAPAPGGFDLSPLAPLLPDWNTVLVWLVQGVLALGFLRLAGEALAALAGQIPGVGVVLAPLIRLLAGQWEKWLTERVPAIADKAVQSVEERFRGTRSGPTKLEQATRMVQRYAPGLSREAAQAQVEAALTRMRGAGLEQKSKGAAGGE
ncbi:hypothetical protein [Calidithermus chliarophilus]|uniref:hypothetical protein n=1 Tax=Calidithermus chliarophilus TaxID=52023 RepID=UPI0003FDF591|nr:hypothetical protein [Calidithermus chliarophilus]